MLRDGCLRPEESDYSLAQFPNTLILVPTRELALQVEAEAQKFTYRTGIATQAVFGGEKPMIQLRKLSTGCDVLVATPGRLIDFLSQGVVSVAAVKNLILDEADRMLDIGFEPQLRQIVEASGMPKDRRTTLFSATFPPSVQNLARDFLSVSIDVKQEIIPVEDKFGMLVQVLRGEERFSELPEAAKTGNCIVFVETKSMADVIEGQLSRIGIRAAAMHGDKSQQQRFRALNAFKKGNTRVLIATDVAARGLDIDDIGLVINYDVPSNIDSYVHRIGRTGRAGREGYAISFVNGRDSGLLPDLKKLFEDNDQPLSEEFHDLMRQCIRSRPRNRNSFRRGHRIPPMAATGNSAAATATIPVSLVSPAAASVAIPAA
ncbi:DED1, partial [Symbiodinium sp. KB8]